MVPLYSHTENNVDIVDQISLEEQVSDEVMAFGILCYIMSSKEPIIQNEGICVLSPLYIPKVLTQRSNGRFEREVEKARSYLLTKSIILAPFCEAYHWPLLVVVKVSTEKPDEESLPAKSDEESLGETEHSTDDVIRYVLLVVDSLDSTGDYASQIELITSLLQAIHSETVFGENPNNKKRSVVVTVKKCEHISKQRSNDGLGDGNDCAFHCLLNMLMFITIEAAHLKDSEKMSLGEYVRNELRLYSLWQRIKVYQQARVQKNHILDTRSNLADLLKSLRLRACNEIINVTPPAPTSTALTISRDMSLLSYRRNVENDTIERIAGQGLGYSTPSTSTALAIRKQSVFVLTASETDGMRISSTSKDPHELLDSNGFYSVTNVIKYKRLPVHKEYEGSWHTLIENWLTNSERATLNIIQSVNVSCRYRVTRRSQLETEKRPKTFTEVGLFLDETKIPSYVIVQFDFSDEHNCSYDHDVRLERFRVANQFYAAVMLSALAQSLVCRQADVLLKLMNVNIVHVNGNQEYKDDNACEPIEKAIVQEIGFTLIGGDWIYVIHKHVTGFVRRRPKRLVKRTRDNDTQQRADQHDSDEEYESMKTPDAYSKVWKYFSDHFMNFMSKDKNFLNLQDEERLGADNVNYDDEVDDNDIDDVEDYERYDSEDYEGLDEARRKASRENLNPNEPVPKPARKRRKTGVDPPGMDMSHMKSGLKEKLLSIAQILAYVKQMLDSDRIAEVMVVIHILA